MDRLLDFSFPHRPRRFTSAKLGIAVVLLTGLSFGNATPAAFASGKPASLQAIGKPVFSTPTEGANCGGFKTPAEGAHLVVTGGAKGGKPYQSGFQLTATTTCYDRVFGATWKLPAKYTVLKADVGFDLSNATTCDTDIVRFLGNAGQMLPFTANGKTVEGAYIPKTGVRAVTVSLAKQSVLTVQVTYVPGTCPAGPAAIDVVNDHLS